MGWGREKREDTGDISDGLSVISPTKAKCRL